MIDFDKTPGHLKKKMWYAVVPSVGVGQKVGSVKITFGIP